MFSDLLEIYMRLPFDDLIIFSCYENSFNKKLSFKGRNQNSVPAVITYSTLQ